MTATPDMKSSIFIFSCGLCEPISLRMNIMALGIPALANTAASCPAPLGMGSSGRPRSPATARPAPASLERNSTSRPGITPSKSSAARGMAELLRCEGTAVEKMTQYGAGGDDAAPHHAMAIRRIDAVVRQHHGVFPDDAGRPIVPVAELVSTAEIGVRPFMIATCPDQSHMRSSQLGAAAVRNEKQERQHVGDIQQCKQRDCGFEAVGGGDCAIATGPKPPMVRPTLKSTF